MHAPSDGVADVVSMETPENTGRINDGIRQP
jgi:hypothetical protein